MFRGLIIAGAVLLTGCNTPKVGFRFTAQKSITVGKNSFTVFYNKTHAQALRHNRIKLRQTAQVQADAVAATQSATGCKVRPGSIKGDPGLVEMALNCPK